MSAEIGRETTTYSQLATKNVSAIAPPERTFDWPNTVTWTVSNTAWGKPILVSRAYDPSGPRQESRGSSRFLPRARRIVGSEDENGVSLDKNRMLMSAEVSKKLENSRYHAQRSHEEKATHQ